MFFYLIFSLLVCIHLYLYIKILVWKGKSKWQLLLLAWFALMLSVWWFRHLHTSSPWIEQLFTLGFAWLGFSIVAACCFLFFDALGCLRLIWRRCKKNRVPPSKKPSSPFVRCCTLLLFFPWHALKAVVCFFQAATKRFFRKKGADLSGTSVGVILLIATLLSVYALWEAQNIQPYYVTIGTKKLPKGINKRRIVLVSDVHLSRAVGAETLERIITITNEAKPDIFISLGDLVDTDMTERQGDAAILRNIIAPLGKYAVLGNHESYRGVAQSIAFHQLSDLRLLRGERVAVGGIVLAGIDDPLIQGKTRQRIAIAKALPADSTAFTMLLSHRPKVHKKSIGTFDLQVSGHTHGGQMWPGSILFGLLIHKVQGHLSRVEHQGKSAWLFVTNGAGYWGPPMRFLTPPEVVILDIVRE